MNNAIAKIHIKLGTMMQGGIFATIYGGTIGTVGGAIMRLAHASPGAVGATEVLAATVAMGTGAVIANKSYEVIQAMIEERIREIPDLRFFRKTHTEDQIDKIVDEMATLEARTFVLGSGIAAGAACMLIG